MYVMEHRVDRQKAAFLMLAVIVPPQIENIANRKITRRVPKSYLRFWKLT
jgi:hypothetical protein